MAKAIAKPAAKKTVAKITKPASGRTSRSSRTARTTRTAAVKAEAPTVAANARKVLLAGIGAANRVQDEATKVYAMIAAEAQRLSTMTTEAAETLAKKANVYVQSTMQKTVKEGKKVQGQAAAVAQAKAAEVAKEVKAFAKKSEATFKQNFERTLSTTMASAKQGVTQGVTQLEHVFENRVAKTLNTFGIPSSQNVRELQARMADLQKALNQLNKRGARV